MERRRRRRKHIPWLLITVVLLAVLVTCAVVLKPEPLNESVIMEAGCETIPLDQFPKEDKEVTLVTDISGIALDQPGEHRLEFQYKRKLYTSVLKIVDTTAPVGTPVAKTIYNDETLTPEAFVTDITEVTETAISFESTPDFTKLGDQTVTICLTDTSGNVGKVEATLTVIADTTAPVFSAMTELRVNLGETVSYRKNITATDDRDGELTYTVDASAVNLQKEGTYTIVYEATDSSGNTTKTERHIFVSEKPIVTQEMLDSKVETVLKRILKDGMSKHEKIEAIYNYVRGHIVYSNVHDRDVITAAYNAIMTRKGDCYNYFALAKVLLDACGIDNLPVERYQGKSSHYWLLVNIGSGWYHYDTSPQSAADPFRCFMKTDAQVKYYSEHRSDGRNDYYQYDESKYPARATEKYKES